MLIATVVKNLTKINDSRLNKDNTNKETKQQQSNRQGPLSSRPHRAVKQKPQGIMGRKYLILVSAQAVSRQLNSHTHTTPPRSTPASQLRAARIHWGRIPTEPLRPHAEVQSAPRLCVQSAGSGNISWHWLTRIKLWIAGVWFDSPFQY